MKSKITRIIFISLLLCMLFSVTGFAEMASVDTSLTVKQDFRVQDGKKPHAGDTFDYILSSVEPENPMPAGADGSGSYAFSISGKGVNSARLDFRFLHGGVYNYVLKLNMPEKKEHYTYDETTYKIAAYVKNTEGGGLDVCFIIQDGQGKKLDNAYYEHQFYIPSGKPKTGDSAMYAVYAALMLVSGTAACLLFCMGRKASGRPE